MIDWSELKTYQETKYHSFEELCYQIAKGIYGEQGTFTRVDDSGGGDGVEFYMTLPNGDQWGWQAKFYQPTSRLSVSGRKQSITGSLEKACQEHTHLKKWILCTPSNFTKQEQRWFKNTLCESIPENMRVELEHWGDSEFNDWLSKPSFSGKRSYFFGELELNIDWFKTQFDKQMAAVGGKFSSALHTETWMDAHIHALLGDKEFLCQITELIGKLQNEYSDLKEAVDDLKRPIPNEIEWDSGEKSKVVKAAESLQDTLANVIGRLQEAEEFLNEGRISEAQAIDWACMYTQLKKAFDNYGIVGFESGLSKIEYTGKEEREDQVLRDATWMVRSPSSMIADLLDDFFHSAMERCKLINQPNLNILGEAGIGKTHIACNICNDRLNTGLPALFIRGSHFTSDRPIEEQLRNILDIPPSYSWNDFLQALSAAAEAYHTRIPLIIDGLNESTHNGAFSNIWRLGLKGFIQEIAQTKNLVLITTCRTSYKEAIWEDEDSPNRVCAYGFNTDEVEQAIEKYFNEYRIKADLTGTPLTQFEHPIYLKIFCESKNRDRKAEKHIYVGEQTLFEVFDEYLNQCNRTVCDRLGLPPRTPMVQPALNKMAAYLWKNRSRHISLEELVCIIDNQSLEELAWLSSRTHAIESEGLLVCRDWIEIGEAMYFTHDLLGGYLIAKYLIQQAADDVHSFLHHEETVAALFGEDYQTLHPLHSDICRCLAALLPAKTGKLLHDFSDNEMAFGLSIEALFEISPQYINQDCVVLVDHLFNHQQNRELFLKLAETTVGHTNHPFNVSFWSKQLSGLPMPERDLSWTEHVRDNTADFEKRLMRFEEACQSNQKLSDTSGKRLHLLAEYIMWVLTSTVRPLRDKATRALYWYGCRFPQDFFDLAMKSLSINDPYIPERMLAATYGVAMARQHDFQDDSFVAEMLPVYGRQLYDAIFKPKAPHSTTHILARDYARRTIDIALIHHPDLLTEDERKYITPPFTEGGIRKWGESEDREAGRYRDGNAPLGPDFANYTLGGLVKDRNNYDFEHSEYKRVRANIFWRIHNLGYSLDDFGEIDKWIHQVNWNYSRSADGGKTDRYGKKYSWIAYYELAGFRQDKNLLPDYLDDPRIPDVDIDPSFPAGQQEYNLVKDNFLGDSKISTKEWVSKSKLPDLTPYLRFNQLRGEEESWILLDGYLRQKDDRISREMFAFVRGLIVKSEESTEIVDGLKREKIAEWIMLSYPGDYYTYAGEILWCNTYPKNNWEELSFKIGSILVPRERHVFLRNGEPISEEERHEFFNSIVSLIGTEDEEAIEALLREQGLEFTVETVKVEEPRYRTFEILYPVRENNWEDHRSAIIDSRSIITPSRQITEMFSLCRQPQNFDLFEKDGRRASITIGCGRGWREKERFTYLREDLLKHYLAEINGELIWAIRGKRYQIAQDPDALHNQEVLSENFEEVQVYSDITKLSSG